MRTYQTLTLLSIVAIALPAAAALSPGDTNGVSISIGTLTRHYDVHVPPGYDGSTAVPLVLDFHGYTLNPAAQKSWSGSLAQSDAHGFIVAYPEGYDPAGTQRSWNAGTCCGPALAAAIDDVAFARAIVADIEAQANIDPQRVYATGLSNGGMMTHRLACEAADLFAAFVAVAGPLSIDPFSTCAPSRPVPIIHFAGLTDTVVPYLGGQSGLFPEIFVASSPASFAHWVSVDGCTGPPTIETFPDGASCEIYTTCTDGAVTGLCSIHGTYIFNHVLYVNDDGVDIAQRTWSFFSGHSLPGIVSTTTSTTSITVATTSSTSTTTPPASASCAAAPAPGCMTAGKAGISINEKRSGREKLKLALKGLTTLVRPADLGDPVSGTTSYAICVYSAASTLVADLQVDRAGDMCAGVPCWKASAAGPKYGDAAASAAGVRSIVTKAGDAGKGQVKVVAQNKAPALVSMPTGAAAALTGATSVTVRVVTSDGACFGATLGTVSKADGLVFKAKAP